MDNYDYSLSDEKEDLKSIQEFANRFKLLTPEEERVLTIEFYNLKITVVNLFYLYGKNPAKFHPSLPSLLFNLVSKLEKLSNDLVNRNLRLIIRSAQSPAYTNKGLPIFDLFMEGYDGLRYAIYVKYNPYKLSEKTGKTNKLSTYVTPWIKQRIGRAIEKKGSAIKVAGHIQSIMSKIRRVVREYVAKNQSKPGPEEIVKLLHETYPANKSLLGITPDKVSEYGRLAWQLISLDEVNNAEEGSASIGSFIEAPACYEPEVMHEEVERRELIDSILDQLDFDSKFIISYKFGLIDTISRSPKAIAKLMQITLKEYTKKGLIAVEKFKKIAENMDIEQYY